MELQADRRVLDALRLRISPVGSQVAVEHKPDAVSLREYLYVVPAVLVTNLGSTLLSGERVLSKDTKIGYFAQHQLELLRPEHSPIDHLRDYAPKDREQDHRNYLGRFGFSGERIFEPVAPFSGGEKARLVLALMIRQGPNLLLLDEPTNHLDLEMRQALSVALIA